MRRIPVVLCIDVEPDGREIDPRSPKDWLGFEATCELADRLRPSLHAATGVSPRFTWFLRMDPQVAHTYGSADWVGRRYPGLIERLQASGDELGLHVHAWRWVAVSGRWVSDYGDQEWVDHCVRSSFAAFEALLARPCRSFRFGDHWMNGPTLDLVEALGARFDLTLEPGREAVPGGQAGEAMTGSFPDCAGIPHRPYRPSRTDFRQPGVEETRQLWVIPVSTAWVRWPFLWRASRMCAWAARRLLRGGGDGAITVGRAVRWLGDNRSRSEVHGVLNLATNSVLFGRVMEQRLAAREMPHLVVTARTDASLDRRQRANLDDNVGRILSHRLLGRLVFETPAAAMARLC